MFQPSPAVRIFLYQGIADMRMSFDGLGAIVTQKLEKNVLNGDYFVFFNRNRDRCKILTWDRDGMVVWAKRLERGSFQKPRSGESDQLAIELDATTLTMILSGIDLNSIKKRKRFSLSA